MAVCRTPGFLALAVLLLAATVGCRHVGPVRADALLLADLEGRRVAPLEHPDGPAVCLIFLAPDCPISNVYAPEIERIHDAYGPRRVRTYLVYAGDAFGAAEIRRHRADFGLSAEALLDPHGALAARIGATVTPEAAVWTADEGLVYRGRIDDLYVDFGKRRAEATSHDLRNALDAVLAGRPPAVRRTQAIGCFLPGRDTGEGAHHGS